MIQKTITNQAIFYGNFVKSADFIKPIYVHSNERKDFSKKEGGDKRDDSLSRSRITLYRLIHANLRRHGDFPPVFLTLTYQINQQDIKQSNKDFRLYIKRLNFHLRTKLRYICVPEFQQRGAVHYHVMFFNIPFRQYKFFQDTWGHGSTRIEKARDVKNLAAYMAKYLTKDTIIKTLKNNRILLTSRGLLRPQKYDNEDAQIQLQRVTITEVLSSIRTDTKQTKESKFIYANATS